MSKSPPTINEEEAEKLLAALQNERGTLKQEAKGIRNYLIALLMLDAGLRVGEVVKLQVNMLYFSGEPVHTLILTERITKNHVERSVPTSQRIRHATKAMVGPWWNKYGPMKYPFAFFHSNSVAGLTTRQIERIISTAAMKSIGRSIHPHILRHTFASRLMRKVNIRIVQELLGHKDVTTTQIYTHPNEDDKRKAIEGLGQPDL